MKKIYIYEPAMCYPTDLCGPSIDPELLRMSFIMHNINNVEVDAVRFNLINEPQVFVDDELVIKALDRI